MAWELNSSADRRTGCATVQRLSSVVLLLTSGLLACGAGCRTSQQTSIPNPFLSADRVPAPPSRIPAAGTAQPYYPGDAMPPLPQPAMQPLGALPPSPDITPIPADTTYTQIAPRATESVASNEPGVRIPDDDSSMRFAAVPQATPTVAAPQAAPVAETPVPNTTAFTNPQAPPATAPVISNWPPVSMPEPQATLSPVSNEGATSGLFRDPTLPAQAPPLWNETPPGTETTTPRIRVPGAEQRVREDVVTPGTINTTSYQVGIAGGGQTETAIVPGVASPSPYAAPAAGQNMSDGFRPRGTSQRASDPGSIDVAPSGTATLHVTPG